VTVLQKRNAHATLGDEALPERLEGVVVDVAAATPLEQWQFHQARAAAVAGGGASPAAPPAGPAAHRNRRPRWGGAPAQICPPPRAAPALEAARPDTLELVRTSKYERPPGLRLDEVTAPMSVLCHCSPDAGWTNLSKFFQGVSERLTVAMYDFTAPHVLNGLRS